MERVLVPYLSLNILLSEPVIGFAGSTPRVDVLTTPAGIDVHVVWSALHARSRLCATLTTMGRTMQRNSARCTKQASNA